MVKVMPVTVNPVKRSGSTGLANPTTEKPHVTCGPVPLLRKGPGSTVLCTLAQRAASAGRSPLVLCSSMGLTDIPRRA